MATLLAVYNSEGLVGRCDAKCHDAARAECDCICGGANHGVGYEQAVENTSDMVELHLENLGLDAQLEQFRRLRNLSAQERLTVAVSAIQPSLPGFDVPARVEQARARAGWEYLSTPV